MSGGIVLGEMSGEISRGKCPGEMSRENVLWEVIESSGTTEYYQCKSNANWSWDAWDERYTYM